MALIRFSDHSSTARGLLESTVRAAIFLPDYHSVSMRWDLVRL
ncbi:unnamed protein product [Amoebophrya sp. A25]|nr:unnamed protein product [Amoebophrya sp. A25]|eukprot:GSA25T00019943001.1